MAAPLPKPPLMVAGGEMAAPLLSEDPSLVKREEPPERPPGERDPPTPIVRAILKIGWPVCLQWLSGVGRGVVSYYLLNQHTNETTVAACVRADGGRKEAERRRSATRRRWLLACASRPRGSARGSEGGGEREK